MSEKKALSKTLVEVLPDLRRDVAQLPPGEKAIVAGGLFVLQRCAGLVERMESVVEEQRASVRRGREVLEMFPPLIGKLGELLDLEVQAARERLKDRVKGR